MIKEDERMGGKYVNFTQILQISSFIAFITLFGKKPNITFERNSNNDNTVSIQDIVDYSDKFDIFRDINGEKFKENIHYCIKQTGLFNIIDVKTYGWSHKNYEDFLSAFYVKKFLLKNKNVAETLDQLQRIYFIEVDSQKEIIKQFLASLSWIINNEPSLIKDLTDTYTDLLLKIV